MDEYTKKKVKKLKRLVLHYKTNIRRLLFERECVNARIHKMRCGLERTRCELEKLGVEFYEEDRGISGGEEDCCVVVE